jgi:hypothetical protein
LGKLQVTSGPSVKVTLPGGPGTNVPTTSKEVPPPHPPAHDIFITTDSAEVGQIAPHCSKLTGTVSQQEKQMSTPSHPQVMVLFLQVAQETEQEAEQEAVRIVEP